MMQWEQRERESDPAYQAFLLYRDQKKGARSITKAASELDKSRALIGRWSSDWTWQARVAAWDEHLQSAADEAQLQATRQMNARHAANGIAMQNKAMERLMGLDVAELTPEQLLRLIESGITIERGARGIDAGGSSGMSVSIQNGKGGTNVSICKLYAGLDMEKFASAHVGNEAAKAEGE